VEGGAEKVKADGTGFARAQWKTWSSPAWFDAVEFEHTAKSFTNPDWVAITLNVYRSRWREGEAWDSRYDPLQQRLHQVEKLAIPTLIIRAPPTPAIRPANPRARTHISPAATNECSSTVLATSLIAKQRMPSAPPSFTTCTRRSKRLGSPAAR
jgi:hypothetical protein